MKPDPSNPGACNKSLKVLDISYNPITEKSLKYIADMIETNRTLEYIGIAKCKIENEHVIPILQ